MRKDAYTFKEIDSNYYEADVLEGDLQEAVTDNYGVTYRASST